MEVLQVENLVEKYLNMVLQIAFQNVLNNSDAEDITQEVFIKLMNSIQNLENEEHAKAWLIRVTINLCKDYNKSFWRKNTTSLDENLKYFDTRDDFELMKEISKLKPVYRNTIYLHYYQGYKINEIAQILNMKENTVSTNLTRARMALKKFIEKEGDLFE